MNLDMDVGTEEDIPKQQRLFKDLYNRLKQVVWVIKVEGYRKGDSCVSTYTGFSVGRDGHVLTCAHGEWHSWSGVTIKARRLTVSSDFEFQVDVVSIKKRWDMCLLKVDMKGLKLKDTECGNLASGNLEVGEPVFLIGHPYEFVGSGVVGHVAYGCTALVENNYGNRDLCETFVSEAMKHTPQYRIMGHIWNALYFQIAENEDSTNRVKRDQNFEKNLHPRLPIIQCSGFIGGDGTSGAPLFNLNGEIVGMVVLQSDGYQIALHVTALKEFLNQTMMKDTEKNPLEGVVESSGKKMKTKK